MYCVLTRKVLQFLNTFELKVPEARPHEEISKLPESTCRCFQAQIQIPVYIKKLFNFCNGEKSH